MHQQRGVCCLGAKVGLRCASGAGKGCEALVSQHSTLANEPMMCARSNKESAVFLRAHHSKQRQRDSSRLLVCREGKILKMDSKIRGDSSPWRRCFSQRTTWEMGYISPKFDVKHPFRPLIPLRRIIFCSILANFSSNLVLNT